MHIGRSTDRRSEILLTREASMASMSLGTGLTLIRKYDFTMPGYFYSSLYLIATGIERLLKLILIYDHRLKHKNAFPNNRDLRNCGHNLELLFDKAVEVNKGFQFGNDDNFYDGDEIYKKIICLLSDFNMTSRYYNLDSLSGRQHSAVEPLKRWELEINSVILRRHYRRGIKPDQVKPFLQIKDNIASVDFTNESGEEISNIYDLSLQSDSVLVKQKYSMYYIYVVIRFLKKLFESLELKGKYYPYLSEYFNIFYTDKKSEILRKKTWNVYEP